MKVWTDAELSDATQAELANLFTELRALVPDIDDNGDMQPRVLPLSSSGKAVLVSSYNEHAAEQAGLENDLAAAFSKLECYAARLAIVVHLVRQVARDRTLQSADAIDAASVQAAVDMVRWFAREAKRVYGILGESDAERDQRELIEWVGRRGESDCPRPGARPATVSGRWRGRDRIERTGQSRAGPLGND